MKDHGASFSDIERAREISRRITGTPQTQPAGPSEPGAQAYVPFSLSFGVGSAPVVSTPAAPTKVADAAAMVQPVDYESISFESWESLLHWCREELDAESAFVVDPQGFVISLDGRLAEDGFEGIGAELSYSMEHLARITAAPGPLKWADFEFQGLRVLAVRVVVSEGAMMVFGFIAPGPSAPQKLAGVQSVVSRHGPRLAA